MLPRAAVIMQAEVGIRKLLELLETDERFAAAWKEARLRNARAQVSGVSRVGLEHAPSSRGAGRALVLREVEEVHLWSDCGPHFRSYLSVPINAAK